MCVPTLSPAECSPTIAAVTSEVRPKLGSKPRIFGLVRAVAVERCWRMTSGRRSEAESVAGGGGGAARYTSCCLLLAAACRVLPTIWYASCRRRPTPVDVMTRESSLAANSVAIWSAAVACMAAAIELMSS